MRNLIIERLARRPALSSAPAQAGLRQAAVLLPLIERAGGMTVLLTQRTSHLQHHPGQISLPGGVIEAADAGAVAAALRETAEEIGIAPHQVEVIAQLEAVIVRTGFHITPVVGFVALPFELRLDRFEVEQVFEVPLEIVLDVRNYELHSRHIEGADVSYHVLNHEGQKIWGATARILLNFARALDVAAGGEIRGQITLE
jgi:8-oxo-dGTP pyrophosphatase MutT (NUDIX family)